MTNKDFMRIAIKQAERSEEPLKCGVVIVKNGEIISQAFNSQRKDYNATSHAEIKAIVIAGKKLGKKNLDNCILYATCEPCTMCLSAIIFSNIKTVFYGTSGQESGRLRIDVSTDYLLSKSPRHPKVIDNFLVDECRKLLK